MTPTPAPYFTCGHECIVHVLLPRSHHGQQRLDDAGRGAGLRRRAVAAVQGRLRRGVGSGLPANKQRPRRPPVAVAKSVGLGTGSWCTERVGLGLNQGGWGFNEEGWLNSCNQKQHPLVSSIYLFDIMSWSWISAGSSPDAAAPLLFAEGVCRWLPELRLDDKQQQHSQSNWVRPSTTPASHHSLIYRTRACCLTGSLHQPVGSLQITRPGREGGHKRTLLRKL